MLQQGGAKYKLLCVGKRFTFFFFQSLNHSDLDQDHHQGGTTGVTETTVDVETETEEDETESAHAPGTGTDATNHIKEIWAMCFFFFFLNFVIFLTPVWFQFFEKS